MWRSLAAVVTVLAAFAVSFAVTPVVLAETAQTGEVGCTGAAECGTQERGDHAAAVRAWRAADRPLAEARARKLGARAAPGGEAKFRHELGGAASVAAARATGEWCGTKRVPHSTHQHNEGREVELEPSGRARRLAEPNVCTHSATVCDYSTTLDAYIAAADSIPVQQINVFVMSVKDAAGVVHPSGTEIARAETALNGAYGGSKVQFVFQQKVFDFTSTWPDARRAVDAVVVDGCPASWVGDGVCDDDCNYSVTDFDGGDCATGPSDGPIPSRTQWCTANMIGDGTCDAGCNSKQQNWDGGDCCPDTNPNFATNYPLGLGITFTARGNSFQAAGCVDPSSQWRSWFGLDRVAGGEYKAIFQQCTTSSGASCASSGLQVFVPWYDPESRGLGMGTFPWDSGYQSWSGGFLENRDAWQTEVKHSTIIHEVGHCMGLYHVHNDEDCPSACYDPPNSASTIRGDLMSDTMSTNRNFRCADPSDTDCSNEAFQNTPFKNWMSYSDDACMDRFSTQQHARVRCFVDLTMPTWLKDGSHVTGVIPSGPVLFSSGSTAATIRMSVSWGAAVSGDSNVEYRLQRAKWDGSGWVETAVLASGSSATSFTDGGDGTLQEGYYYVYAVFAAIGGGEYGPSASAYAVAATGSSSKFGHRESGAAPPPPPPPPTSLPDWADTASSGGICLPSTDVTNPSGTLRDGSGVNQYPNNITCVWNIGPQEVDLIGLEFSTFDVDVSSTAGVVATYSSSLAFVASPPQPSDSVEVRDSHTNQLILSHTGDQVPNTLLVVRGVRDAAMTVTFLSDDTHRGEGFSARYYSCSAAVTCSGHGQCDDLGSCACDARFGGASCDQCALNYENYPLCEYKPPPKTCEGVATLGLPSGHFDDGSGDSAGYSSDLDCSWLIQPQLDGGVAVDLIVLAFDQFWTEEDHDGIVVDAGDDPSSGQRLLSHSGSTLPAVVAAEDTAIVLSFWSDSTTEHAGWSASYTACTEILDFSTARTDTPAVCMCGGEVQSDLRCFNCAAKTYHGDPFCGICPLPQLLADGECNSANNIAACNWDAGDCCVGSNCDKSVDHEAPFVFLAPQSWTTGSLTSDTWITFQATASEPGCTYFFSLDGASSVNSTTGVASFDDLAVGEHEVSLYAVDPSGNVGVSISYRWTVQAAACEKLAVLHLAADGTLTSFTDGSEETAEYGRGVACSWLLLAPAGSAVELGFSRFDLEPGVGGASSDGTSHCVYDAVTMFDGPVDQTTAAGGAASPVLRKLCGSPAATSSLLAVNSTSNALLVTFKTDLRSQALGFAAQARALPRSPSLAGRCAPHTVEFAESGVLTDGSAPDEPYVAGLNCLWELRAPAGHVVALDVTRFFVHPVEQDGICHDFVRVRDGLSSSSPDLLSDHGGRACGNDVQSITHPDAGAIYSSGSTMQVQFYTAADSGFDGVNATGFSATYSVVESPYSCDSLQGAAVSSGTGAYQCTGNAVGDACTPKCADGWRLDVATQLASLGVRKCTVSLGAASWSGVEAVCVPAGCAPVTQLVSSASGYVTEGTPRGGSYAPETTCEWRISAPTDDEGVPLSLAVNVLRLNVEPSASSPAADHCSYDSLTLYDGLGDDGVRIARLCGVDGDVLRLVGSSFAALSGALRVVWTADRSVNFMGFALHYEAVEPAGCRGRRELAVSERHFSDGSGAGDYSANSMCEWVVRSPRDHNASVTFVNVALQSDVRAEFRGETGNVVLRGPDAAAGASVVCSADSVSVFSLADGVWQPVGIFCGSFPDATAEELTFGSPSGSMLVRFSSDGAVEAGGFDATVTYRMSDHAPCMPLQSIAVSAAAGASAVSGVLTDGTAVDENYRDNALCAWRLEAPPGWLFEVEFTRLDIEEGPHCIYDAVRVFGVDETGDQDVTPLYDDQYYIYDDDQVYEDPLDNGVRVYSSVLVALEDGQDPATEGVPAVVLFVSVDHEVTVIFEDGSTMEHVPVSRVVLGSDMNLAEASPMNVCGSAPEDVGFVVSTGNAVTVLLDADRFVTRTGFEMTWTAFDPAAEPADCSSAADIASSLGVDVGTGYFMCDSTNAGGVCRLHCSEGSVYADADGEVILDMHDIAAHTSTHCSREGSWTPLREAIQCVPVVSASVPDSLCDTGSSCTEPNGYCTRWGCACSPGYTGDGCRMVTAVDQHFWHVTPWEDCSVPCDADGQADGRIGGVTNRTVRCFLADPSRLAWLPADESNCVASGARLPAAEQACNAFSCDSLPASGTDDNAAAVVGGPARVRLMTRYSIHTLGFAAALERISPSLELELATALSIAPQRLRLVSYRAVASAQSEVGGHGRRQLLADLSPAEVDLMVLPSDFEGDVTVQAAVRELEILAEDEDSSPWQWPTLRFVVPSSLEVEYVRAPPARAGVDDDSAENDDVSSSSGSGSAQGSANGQDGRVPVGDDDGDADAGGIGVGAFIGGLLGAAVVSALATALIAWRIGKQREFARARAPRWGGDDPSSETVNPVLTTPQRGAPPRSLELGATRV